jgi:hypothetical protein
MVASTAFLFAVTGVSAQSVDEDTSCGAVVKVMTAPSPDQLKAKEILGFALQTMQAVDRLHRLRGQTEIFPQMSEGLQSSIALFVAQRCHNREGLTLADTAIETYEAIRRHPKELALADGDEGKLSVPLTVIAETARPRRSGSSRRRWARPYTTGRTVSSRWLRPDDELWLKQVD